MGLTPPQQAYGNEAYRPSHREAAARKPWASYLLFSIDTPINQVNLRPDLETKLSQPLIQFTLKY